MLRQSAFLILTTLAVVYAACNFSPQSRVELDMTRYQGRWYLIETGPLRNQTGPLNCIYEEYTATNNPLVLNFNWHGQTNNGTIVPDTGIVTIPREEEAAKLDFYLDETVFHSMIVATDYTSWALEYTCHEDIGFERFMLRSRQTTLNVNVRQTLKSLIEGFGVNGADFAQVNHSNCVL